MVNSSPRALQMPTVSFTNSHIRKRRFWLGTLMKTIFPPSVRFMTCLSKVLWIKDGVSLIDIILKRRRMSLLLQTVATKSFSQILMNGKWQRRSRHSKRMEDHWAVSMNLKLSKMCEMASICQTMPSLISSSETTLIWLIWKRGA
jgi:hypothetical protein